MSQQAKTVLHCSECGEEYIMDGQEHCTECGGEMTEEFDEFFPPELPDVDSPNFPG